MTAQEQIRQVADELSGRNIKRKRQQDWAAVDTAAAELDRIQAEAAKENHRGLGIQNCPGCDGMGYVRYELHVYHPDFGKMHVCPECGAPKITRKPVITGVPPMYANDRLTDLAIHPGREAFESWLIHIGEQMAAWPHGFWGVVGNKGSGKTWGSYVIVNEALDSGHSARYVLASQLMEDLRKASSFDSLQSREDVLRPIELADVLVIDQLDWLRTTEFAVEQARLLIDSRYQRRDHRLTILLVNREDKFWQEQGGSELGVVFSRVGGRWVDTQVDDLRPLYEREAHHEHFTHEQDEGH